MTIAGLYNLQHLEQVKRAVEEIGGYVYHIEEVAPGYYNVETTNGGATHTHAAKIVGDTIEVF